MKKTLIFLTLFFTVCSVYAQNKKSAEIIRKEALKQETVQDSIDYLKRNLSFADTAADTRSLLYFTGTLQEQLGLYTDASNSYAKAAGIAAGDAVNMPKVSSEQLVLDAVRTSLSAGNWETADSYLNSAVRTSKNENITATAKLYSIWSELCKASSVPDADISDSIAMLKAYSTMQSMKTVRPQILLTLWHLTSDNSYADTLKKEFPSSPETSIVNGTAQIMRVPFWYFVPRQNDSTGNTDIHTGIQTSEQKSVSSGKEENKIADTKNSPEISSRHPGKKQQLGLFRQKENADECIRNAAEKGFDAYCYTETRASGNTYFIVVVDENPAMTMGQKLKAAGIDCYTIE